MGSYKHRRNKQPNKRELLKRDDFRCGIHIDGCGALLKHDEANIDHIIPKRFFHAGKTNRNKLFNQDWNKQPMHSGCNTQRNNEGSPSDIKSFPEFTCECHRLVIDGGVLYVLASGERYALHSGITTSRPEGGVTSVAKTKQIKGKKTKDGKQLYRTAFVGGNAIVMPFVHEDDVAFFNEVAKTNPTHINKYRWNGLHRVIRGELEGLDPTPRQAVALNEKLEQDDLEVFLKLRRVLWFNLSDQRAEIYCLHGPNGYPGLLSRSDMERLAELLLIKFLPAGYQQKLISSTREWETEVAVRFVSFGDKKLEILGTRPRAALQLGHWDLTGDGRFLIDYYKNEEVEMMQDHFDFNVNAWRAQGFEIKDASNIYVLVDANSTSGFPPSRE